MNRELVYHYKFKDVIFETYNYLPDLSMYKVQQEHTSVVLTKASYSESVPADGLLFNKDDLQMICLAIKTADCLPIALIGEKQVGLFHAGHKGLALEIHRPKSNDHFKVAIIGPSICSDCYEVSSDFHLAQAYPQFLKQKKQRLFFDLKALAEFQLRSWYPKIRVIDSQLCTYEESNLWSYRQNMTEFRNWNIIRLNN